MVVLGKRAVGCEKIFGQLGFPPSLPRQLAEQFLSLGVRVAPLVGFPGGRPDLWILRSLIPVILGPALVQGGFPDLR